MHAVAKPDAKGPLQLQPPSLIQPVQRREESSPRLVPLKKEFKAKVDLRAQDLLSASAGAGLEPGVYSAKVENSMLFGRKAADLTARLVRRFVAKKFDSLEASPAFAALQTLRARFGELNPNNPDDLLGWTKVFGVIPAGNKLGSYFKAYQTAIPELAAELGKLRRARRRLENEAKALNSAQDEIWSAMTKLEAAIYYATTLRSALNSRRSTLASLAPAQALCLEVAEGQLADAFRAWSSQQVNNVNTYLAMEALKKTYRELITGLREVEALSAAALASAQTVANSCGYALKSLPTLTEQMPQPERAAKVSVAPARDGKDFKNDVRLRLNHIRETTTSALYAMRELDEFRFQAIGVVKYNSYKLLQSFIPSPNHPAQELTGPAALRVG